jgi:hypothetical protein
MQMARSLTIFLLWLLGSGVAFAVSVLCVLSADDGKVHAAALISSIWGVALIRASSLFSGLASSLPKGAAPPASSRSETGSFHFRRREPMLGIGLSAGVELQSEGL